MLWALLPFFFIALIFGFTAVERDLASVKPQAAPLVLGAATSTGQEFVMYRQAIITYVQAYPQQLNGVVPMSLPSGAANALPTTAIAVVVPNQNPPNNGKFKYMTCVWMPAPAGTVGRVVNQLGGDLTIGIVVTNNDWAQAGMGGTVLAIPPGCLASAGTASAPSPGYIISVFSVMSN